MNQQLTPNASQGSGLAPNVASLLCYVCTIVTGIIFVIIEKENKEVRFHAWQSIIFGVAAFAIQIIHSILGAIFASITAFIAVIWGILYPAILLALVVVWVVCMVKAYQGERFKIPFIGDMAEKQAGLV